MAVDHQSTYEHVDVYALEVIDKQGYQAYRAAMTPLLHEMGGAFGFDLEVSEVLKNPTGKAFNRVFSIVFESRRARDAFFSDPRYLSIRARHFEPAVGDRTHLGQLQPGVPLP